MNYYQPREMRGNDGQPTGSWHYTVRNDNRIYAVGYCADGCPGHDTPDAARAHYKAYLLDKCLQLDHTMSGQQMPCEVCGAWTQKFAMIAGDAYLWVLCDEHRNRATVDSLLIVGDSVSSW